MNIITQDNHSSELLSSKINIFFNEFHVSQILKSCNAYKLRGFSVVHIFLAAFLTVFCNKSFYQMKKEHNQMIDFEQDTFYRFINSCSINWRKFTLLLSAAVIKKSIEPLTNDCRRNVLIVDDSLFSRGRSKKVELLAKVFDHVSHSYTLGYRMLTLGWTDGNTFLPINHCLLSSPNKKNRLQESSTTVDARSNGGKQRRLAQAKAPQVVLELLKEAKAAAIPADYVLFDTWFCSPSALINIKDVGYDVIAMAKKTETIHYCYQGMMQSALSIYRKEKKRSGRSKYKLSVLAEVVKDKKHIPIKIVFVKNRNKRQDYLILVSTDISLSEEEIIQLYGKRWNIEVFFKVCKSYLKLSKECRSISYDAMTAHVAIVFSRYMMLALEERRNIDSRSIGDLFYLTIDELQDIRYFDALIILLKMLFDYAKGRTLFMDNELDYLLDIFIEKLPDFWSICLKRCA